MVAIRRFTRAVYTSFLIARFCAACQVRQLKPKTIIEMGSKKCPQFRYISPKATTKSSGQNKSGTVKLLFSHPK